MRRPRRRAARAELASRSVTDLPPCPPSPADTDGRLSQGLFGGRLGVSPRSCVGQRGGRLRRWRYAAAAGRDVAIGAAIVDLGYAGAAFAWALADGELATWEDRSLLSRAGAVGDEPSDGASWRRRGARVYLGDRGELVVDVPVGGGRLVAQVGVGIGWPATLLTATPRGGWNVTEKAAGYRARGRVSLCGERRQLDGAGWRDWTLGRQDASTSWRWAAGGGEVDGRFVGLNASTGMNGAGPGEDIVWWDGEPKRLDVKELAPRPDGWRLSGPRWSLDFDVVAERRANERLGPVLSRYVQPVGRFSGTLPGPGGGIVEVSFPGVTEDHEARW